MFNNFIKWSTGRTNVKVIAIILVLTLTFANFAILGSYLTESIANDNLRDSSTNVDNVRFSVYFKDENGLEKTQLDADIDDELILYAKLDVENGGRLQNAQLVFQNSNFKLKDSNEIYKNIGTIGAEEILQIPIVARKDDEYNLDLLNMESNIVLTGEYVDTNGNVQALENVLKTVNINWNTNSLTNEDVYLSQELITNKTYNVDGVNKRIVQLSVKASIQDNKAPVEKEEIKLEVPTLNNKLENVKVVAKTTKATNGKIEYNYNVENGILTINVLNEATENVVSWAKDAQDEFIVTYIYQEDAQVAPFISDANATFDIYGRTEESIVKPNELSLEEVQEVGNVVSFEKYTPNNIYKGYLYNEKDINYNTKEEIFVSCSEPIEKLELVDSGEALELESIASYFKATTINKQAALNLLGEEGTIKIYNSDSMEEPLKEINLAEETEEENYTVTYNNDVDKITVQISKPIQEGKLEILNQKTLKTIDVNELTEVNSMSTVARLIANREENNFGFEIGRTENVELKEPETTIEMILDKETISNQIEEDSISATITLKSSESKHKLFKNPTINIELPKEITDTTIENASCLSNELEKDGEPTIKTNEAGNKVIEIKLVGEQTEYTEALEETNIVVDLKVKANSFMADKNVEVKATCINDGDEEQAQANANLLIKAKDGLLTKSYLTVDGEVKNALIAQIQANSQIEIKTQIINNFGQDLTNVSIQTQIPEGLELISTNNAEKEVLAQGESLELVYSLKALEDLSNIEETLENIVTIEYTLNEIEKEEKITYQFTIEGNSQQQEETNEEIIAQTDKIEASILVASAAQRITDQTPVKEGQMVEYTIKVKNISNEPITNLTLQATKENGTFYTKRIVDNPGQGTDIAYIYEEDSGKISEELTVATLNPEETAILTYRVIVNKNTAGNNLISNVRITANEISDAQITKENVIESGKIKVLMKFGYSDNVKINSYDPMKVIILVENISQEDLTNVKVKYTLPEGLRYMEDSWESETGRTVQGQTITYTISELLKDSSQSITVYSELEDFEGMSKEVTAQAIVEVGEEQYKSNIYKTEIAQAKTSIEATLESSLNSETIKDGDEVIYTITLKNNGPLQTSINVEYELLAGLEIQSMVKRKGESEETLNSGGNLLTVEDNLENGQEIKIIVASKFVEENFYPKDATSITSKAIITGGNFDSFETNEITYNVELLNPEPEEPDNPPEDPDTGDKLKSISGLVWIDENKDGIRNNNERVLQEVKVILLDEQGKVLQEHSTSLTGTYKFTNLKEGNYLIAFKYDTSKYALTKYQVSNAEESNNSDAINKDIIINSETVNAGVTDVLKLSKNDITNIDIGLIENEKFDLRLNKYIEKVVVTNSVETTTYNFGDETNFTKIELGAKSFTGSTVIVEYNIVVTNEGNIDGYVGDIIDYLPKELSFSTEMNENWYVGSDNNLHFMQEDLPAVEPGKSQTIKLVLTKTLSAGSAGTLENIAEIGESSNLKALKEVDSVAGNKKAGEDDISTATLIISIRTGSPIMYIGIVLVSITILAFAIYIINKKVLKESI